MHELSFSFEGKSYEPGKLTLDLKDLWDIHGILPVGEWYIQIEYIYFFNEEKYSVKNIYIQSPQILTENKNPETLALISKKEQETFFCFSSNENSKRFTKIISKKGGELDLETFTISELTTKQRFLADFKAKILITIPYEG
jgi:hypothetical protein